jgi:hypothetical protein
VKEVDDLIRIVEDVRRICDNAKSVHFSFLTDDVKGFLERYVDACKRVDVIIVSYPWVIRVDVYAGDGNIIETRFFDLGNVVSSVVYNVMGAVGQMLSDLTATPAVSVIQLELSTLPMDLKSRLLSYISYYLSGKGFKCYEVMDDKYHVVYAKE